MTQPPDTGSAGRGELARLRAAEEVCWSLMLAVGLGGLDDMPMEWRGHLGEPLTAWCDLAVQTGIMRGDGD